MIHVAAIITAYPGKRAELLEAFKQVMPEVHKEKGCVEYHPVVDVDGASSAQTELGPDAYMVVEKWDSIEDLRVHIASDHMAAFGEAAGHLVADRKVYILEQVVLSGR